MRLIILLLLFSFAVSAQNNIIKTAGLSYTSGVPTFTPTKAGSLLALDTTSWRYYTWNGSSWLSDGFRVQTISGCSAPAYTPTKFQSYLVINACTAIQGGPELYYWNGSAWLQINEGQTYTAGTGIAISGGNVISSTITQADGSETKINVSTALSKTGTGTTGDPYVLTNTAPSLWTLSGSDIYRSSGKVIVGGTSGVGARLNVTNSDASTSLWSRAGDLVFQNSSATNNAWAGIQVNSSGSSLAAGAIFQVYDQANAYGRILFSTRGAVNGFSSSALKIEDGKVGIPAFTTAGNIVSHDISGYLTSITPASLAVLTNYWTLSGSNVYRSTGNVGIGVNATAPVSTLQVDKTTQTLGGATPNGALVITGLGYGNYALELGTDGANSPFIQSRNVASATYYSLLLNPSGGNVGVKTISPTQPLDVDGNARFRALTGFNVSTPLSTIDVAGAAGYNQLRLRTTYTPTGTADVLGNTGDTAWDDNFFYIKTSAGWKRTALSTF